MPTIFGMLSFLFYILLYTPTLGSEDFITALLVFFAAASWSAVIILADREDPRVLNLHLSISIIFPLILPLLFKRFNFPLHCAAIGLIVLAALGLRLFIHYYFKYKTEE